MSKILKYTEYKKEQALFLQKVYYERSLIQNEYNLEQTCVIYYCQYLSIVMDDAKAITDKIKPLHNSLSGHFYNEEMANNINTLMDNIFND